MHMEFDPNRWESEKDKDGAVPIFEVRAVRVLNKTTEEWEFEDQEWIKIFNPADPKTVIEEPVQERHKKRFRKAYDAWRAGKEEPVDGIPIKEFPSASPAEIATLKRLNIHTVEALAELADAQCQNIARGHTLKRKAAEFLEFRKTQGYDTEKQELRDRLAQLEKQLEQLTGGSDEPSDDGASSDEGGRVSGAGDDSGQLESGRTPTAAGSKRRGKTASG